MTLRILGAGFGRTGTLSLKRALEALGVAPCYHMTELALRPDHAAHWAAAARGDAIDWRGLLADFAAAVDWPVAAFWRPILAAFPEARVVLTVRDAASWYASFRGTILAKALGPAPPAGTAVRAMYELTRDVVLDRTFAGRAGDAEHAIAVYERHNRDVIAAVEPRRLLVYEVASGWEPLCAFLGVAAPSAPFPRLNSGAAFRRRYARPSVSRS
jgi:sulfotransferase family protein